MARPRRPQQLRPAERSSDFVNDFLTLCACVSVSPSFTVAGKSVRHRDHKARESEPDGTQCESQKKTQFDLGSPTHRRSHLEAAAQFFGAILQALEAPAGAGLPGVR